MYKNIGGKIKLLAKAAFIIISAASLVSAICLAIIFDELFLLLLLGIPVSFALSWLLYGFGEIIDKLCDIEINTRSEANSASETVNRIPAIIAMLHEAERLNAEKKASEAALKASKDIVETESSNDEE